MTGDRIIELGRVPGWRLLSSRRVGRGSGLGTRDSGLHARDSLTRRISSRFFGIGQVRFRGLSTRKTGDGLCRPSSPESRVPSPKQAGFTLIELLLATVLIGLIMAMAYGGFRASVRATSSGEQRIEETNRLRVVHQFLRRQISHTRPLIIEAEDDEIIRFEGEAERIRFVAAMPGYLGFGGPYVQELRVEPGEAGMDLVFAFAMLNGYEPGDLDREDPITLLEDIGRAEFEFLGYDEDGESVFWSDFWETTDQIPLSVSLRLGMQRDNGLFFPELVTPVVIDSGGAAPRSLDPADIRARMIGTERQRNRR
ncbi:MAG: prepilin-type N-terminal cleavage/methylation domain-containing protein [Wenzhouxiangellaceae bacterium]